MRSWGPFFPLNGSHAGSHGTPEKRWGPSALITPAEVAERAQPDDPVGDGAHGGATEVARGDNTKRAGVEVVREPVEDAAVSEVPALGANRPLGECSRDQSGGTIGPGETEPDVDCLVEATGRRRDAMSGEPAVVVEEQAAGRWRNSGSMGDGEKAAADVVERVVGRAGAHPGLCEALQHMIEQDSMWWPWKYGSRIHYRWAAARFGVVFCGVMSCSIVQCNPAATTWDTCP